MQSTSGSPSQRIPTLDGWRGVAILMVFSCHYLPNAPWPLNQWGWAGVNFFFVLSGFLITGILYDTRDTPKRLRNFYARRALRIFPVYYAALIGGLLLWPFFRWEWHRAWLLAPVYLFNASRFVFLRDYWAAGGEGGVIEWLRSTRFTHPQFYLYYGHFWSLAVEEQFYLAWPLVVFSVKDRTRLKGICAAAFWACLALRIAALFMASGPVLRAYLLQRATPFRVDDLLVGGYLALALRGPERHAILNRARTVLMCCGAVVVLYSANAALHPHSSLAGTSPLNPWVSTLGFSVLSLLSAAIIASSLQRNTTCALIGGFGPLKRLGVISYGFYIFHDIPRPTYGAIASRLRVPHPALFTAALAFAATYALSFLSFRFFESPFLRMKRLFHPTAAIQPATLHSTAQELTAV